jgi:uncharacterized damage-inducible protein DinB
MRAIVGAIEGEYRRYKALGEGAIRQLSEVQLNERGPSGGNSVAILVRHISGNFTSRFTDLLTADGEKPWRDRESEFEARVTSLREVMSSWNEGWETLFNSLDEIEDEQLQDAVTIRGRTLTIVQALERSLAHTSFHVGQIVFWARSLRGASWQFLTIPPGQSEAYNRNPSGEGLPPTS